MANDWIDIDAEEVRDLIRDRGEAVHWYKASPCPCSQTVDALDESSESESCPYGCENGQLYILQELPEEIRASVGIVTDFNKTVFVPDLGRVSSGTAKWIGMANEILLGDQDRLTLTDREELVREVLRRGNTSDALAHPEITNIFEIRQGFTVFEEGSDYELVPGGIATSGLPLPACVHWLNAGNAPELGSFYTIEYGRHSRLTFLSDGNRPARNNLAGAKLVQRLTLTILGGAVGAGQ